MKMIKDRKGISALLLLLSIVSGMLTGCNAVPPADGERALSIAIGLRIWIHMESGKMVFMRGFIAE